MTVQPAAAAPPGRPGRLRSLAPIVIFDTAGPLAVYYGLLTAGMPDLGALIVSGALPALGIVLGAARNRRLDAIGVLVLTGILAGTALGLASGSAHLVLLDGTVPTALFGLLCLGSLWSGRPLMFRFAVETLGAGTPRGREFADKWRYPGFRRAFRVTTVVWGLAFLAEAAVQILIIETTPAGVARTSSTVLPLVFAAVLVAWNISYAKRGHRQGVLAEQAARARGDVPPAMPI